jgi:transposase
MTQVLASHTYWKVHPYIRLNVKDYVSSWVGWETFTELLGYAGSERDKAFLVALLKTGGRVREVLDLNHTCFLWAKNHKVLLVRDMLLEKRYKKTDSYVDLKGKTRWHTEKKNDVRREFPIMVKEPLSQILIDYVKTHGKQPFVFLSPYRPDKPLTRQWAYLMIRKIDRSLPDDLKARLGLDRPLKDKQGKEVAKQIHLWLHWFRSQRASQLVADYDFREQELVEFFTWEDYDTALRYAHKGWESLAQKMKARKLYKRLE